MTAGHLGHQGLQRCLFDLFGTVVIENIPFSRWRGSLLCFVPSTLQRVNQFLGGKTSPISCKWQRIVSVSVPLEIAWKEQHIAIIKKYGKGVCVCFTSLVPIFFTIMIGSANEWFCYFTLFMYVICCIVFNSKNTIKDKLVSNVFCNTARLLFMNILLFVCELETYFCTL